MGSSKFVAYYRVSTERQGRSGLGLDAQRDAVRKYLDGGRWTILEEVTEIESGKRNDRPALAHALSLCRVHNATLIIAKLDRLARNVAFISNLIESGAEFTAVDFPQANRLTVHILAAVAEYEAMMISQRTKTALAAAKSRGVKLGGNRGSIGAQASVGGKASAAVRKAKAVTRANDLLPVLRAIQANGKASFRQLAAELNSRGIAAARGGTWSPIQVQRLLRRSV